MRLDQKCRLLFHSLPRQPQHWTQMDQAVKARFDGILHASQLGFLCVYCTVNKPGSGICINFSYGASIHIHTWMTVFIQTCFHFMYLVNNPSITQPHIAISFSWVSPYTIEKYHSLSPVAVMALCWINAVLEIFGTLLHWSRSSTIILFLKPYGTRSFIKSESALMKCGSLLFSSRLLWTSTLSRLQLLS